MAARDVYWGVSTLPFLILLLTSIYIMQGLANELSEGGAIFLLSHPVSRVEYVASWFVVSVLAPIGSLVLAAIAVLLALGLAPELALTPLDVSAPYIELVTVLSITMLLTLVFKTRSTPVLAGVLLGLAPIGLQALLWPLTLALAKGSQAYNILATLVIALSLLYPTKMWPILDRLAPWFDPLSYIFLSPTLAFIALLVYAERRLEVS